MTTPPPSAFSVTVDDGTDRLTAIRTMVRSNPRLALNLLVGRHGLDPVTVSILLAETYQRLGQHRHAMVAAEQAACAEASDTSQLLTSRAVHADTACWLGGQRALRACHDYAHLAVRHGDVPRVLLAASLYAVAIYNLDSCREGRRRLARLRDRACQHYGNTHSIAVAITNAGIAMRYGCHDRAQPDRIDWTALPGGQADNILTGVSPDALACRTRRRSATHTCITRRPR